MQETLPHWLTKQAYLSPNKVAIETQTGNTLTFLQLKNKSISYARKLAQFGIEKGTHVGILSQNCTEMIIAIHAISYLGAVSVLLNTRLTDRELMYQLEDAKVTIVLTDGCKDDEALPFQTTLFDEVSRLEETAAHIYEEMNVNDPFSIIYTSGTTGLPKGVVHSYGNHWWSAIGSALNLGVSQTDRWLAMLPLFHVGGLSIFIRSVIYGMPVVLLEKFEASIANEMIVKKGITIVSVVTVMLQQMIKELGDACYPESLRCMLLGGGPAPKSLLIQAKNKHVPVFQSYGMTETSSQIVTLSPADALQKLNSAGKPLFPGQVKIEQKGPDTIGEVFVKGPMVTKGYYNADEKNKETFVDGWLKTGDLGYFDGEGFLYIVDRRSDLIISGGENIYPTEIESVLSDLLEIKEVGVVGMQDNKWGEVPVAFIVKDKEITKEKILNFAQENLAKYKVPKKIYFINKLPRNASNKLVRNKLVEQLKAQEND